MEVRIVGSVLVRNEDVFVERAIRNVAEFCDRIFVFDHMSEDGTWDILRRLARELDHLEVHRSPRSSDSHRPLEPFAGQKVWALGVDGDELFDPAGLARLREPLLAGEHDDVFRLKAHVLNCEQLDRERRAASGYMSPPSRPVTKLFNLAAVDAWLGSSQRLHDGQPEFRPGYHWESMRYLSETLGWSDDPLRCLHMCFLNRSSLDDGNPRTRRNITESGLRDRSWIGSVKRRLRPPHRSGTDWKREWYARGERVTVDTTPFLGHVAN
jgi:Glycosyl transferase family 2